jgi:hypothetical protein
MTGCRRRLAPRRGGNRCGDADGRRSCDAVACGGRGLRASVCTWLAVWKRQPVHGHMYHSDHESKYTALAFGERCQAVGNRGSKGSVRIYFRNALAERFVATVECVMLPRFGGSCALLTLLGNA